MRLVSIDMISSVLFVFHMLMFSINSCGEGLLFLDFSFLCESESERSCSVVSDSLRSRGV